VTININVMHGSPQHEQILMKLSELTGTVASIETKVDAATVKLDAFLAVAGDPPVPADAEAGLTRISDKVTALDAKIPPAA
jgi:hypothetical protein